MIPPRFVRGRNPCASAGLAPVALESCWVRSSGRRLASHAFEYKSRYGAFSSLRLLARFALAAARHAVLMTRHLVEY
jgi:hypothetical protein